MREYISLSKENKMVSMKKQTDEREWFDEKAVITPEDIEMCDVLETQMQMKRDMKKYSAKTNAEKIEMYRGKISQMQKREQWLMQTANDYKQQVIVYKKLVEQFVDKLIANK